MLKRLLRVLVRRNPPDSRAGNAAVAGTQVQDALERYQSGDRAAAEALCRAALALDPRQAQAWSVLARLALDGEEPERALECYAHVLAIDPDDPGAMVDAGEVNRRAGHLSRALELSERALALRPRDIRAWRVRRCALADLGRLHEALDCLRHELVLAPDDIGAHSDLLFLLNRTSSASAPQLLAEHRAWAATHADRFASAASAFANPPEAERVLRIGYVSADFRDHAVAYFIEPVLRRHDRARCEVYCYFSWPRPDEVTQRLRRFAHHWRDIAALSDDEAARLVRDDGIDILVDLSGHTLGNRLLLFARKPAPIQMTWLGYHGTIGMRAMDYRITDRHVDPPGLAEAYYCERLVRLPRTFACYQPPAAAPEVNALPALERGYVTFGSFNKFSKLSAESMHAWARLLSLVPQGRLRVRGAPEGEAFDRFLEIFEAEGVYADRIDTIGRGLPFGEYLAQYLQADLALDPHPYNGSTTTMESLWMGIPVISLAGSVGLSRCSASHLSNIGLQNLVARSWDDYVRIGVELAADLPRLAQLRDGMRERLCASPLMDAPGFTRDLEAAYRAAWRSWCARAASGGGVC